MSGRPSKIVIATVAVFVTLLGMMAVVGLLFDEPTALHGGAIALIAGVCGFVVMLNVADKRDA
ncbi:DUF2964 family protein [Burkholderia multivorans]|nr:DUF2964 family protein [Burkholderia multivorans]